MRQKINLAVVLLSTSVYRALLTIPTTFNFAPILRPLHTVSGILFPNLYKASFFFLHHSEICFTISYETLFLTPTQSISLTPSLSVFGCVSFCLIEEHLIYNVVLGSGVQQSDSVMPTCTCFLDSFSLQGMYIFAFTQSFPDVPKLTSFFACLTGLSPSSSMRAGSFFFVCLFFCLFTIISPVFVIVFVTSEALYKNALFE